VYLIRNSLAFLSWKDRKAILPAIKAIHRADNADLALVRLEQFEAEWGDLCPAIGALGGGAETMLCISSPSHQASVR
jgi:putative transposase